MANYILPIILISLLIYANSKKVNCYQSFINGSSSAINLVLQILPYIASVIIAVELFRISGMSLLLSNILNPVFLFLGIPSQVSELVLLRPLSGAGSIGLLSDIINQYGPDSYISRCACTIMGSSETIFYVCSIYLSKTNIKKLPYAIPIALFASLIGAIIACFLVKIM